jgi:hypothetical protein
MTENRCAERPLLTAFSSAAAVVAVGCLYMKTSSLEDVSSTQPAEITATVGDTRCPNAVCNPVTES